MIHEKVEVTIDKRGVVLPKGYVASYWQARQEKEGYKATLTTYVIDNSHEIDAQRRRPAVLICPGGGYGMKSEREAEAVAIAMNARGFQAFVLDYSVEPAVFPEALLQVAKATSIIRARAQEWHVHPERIVVAGFSAGGHVAASLGVYYHEPWVADSLGLSAHEIAPNGLLLSYPVILAHAFAHEGSMINLFGNAEKINWEFGAIDTLVTDKTPPTFIWHTGEDVTVPVENALTLAMALRQHGVPFDLHVFQKGVHGLSLASEETACKGYAHIEKACQPWVDLFAAWMAEQA